MNRYRGPTIGGPSRATASTLCQKCLKKGHYSYECKAAAQERPYVSRPSRTQQLLNPKLVPKLTSDVPNDLLRKKGIADEQLAKKEEERGRKRSRDRDDPLYTRQPSRSASSSSFASISTVSTNLSRSPAPRASSSHRDTAPLSSNQNSDQRKRRRRSVSSSASGSSDSSLDAHGSRSSKYHDRNTRLRRNSTSPAQRGRRRSRSYTPAEREQQKRVHSKSFDRSKIARHRRSITPDDQGPEQVGNRRERSPRELRRGHDRLRDAQRRYSNDDDRYGSSYRENGTQARHGRRSRPPSPPPRKERSLSPFSKRLALTQAMNMGR